MSADRRFFEHPVLNSPYEYPSQYWELDESGQPTNRIVPARRPAAFITAIPNPKWSCLRFADTFTLWSEGSTNERPAFDSRIACA